MNGYIYNSKYVYMYGYICMEILCTQNQCTTQSTPFEYKKLKLN
jgi:hypothetical protein